MFWTRWTKYRHFVPFKTGLSDYLTILTIRMNIIIIIITGVIILVGICKGTRQFRSTRHRSEDGIKMYHCGPKLWTRRVDKSSSQYNIIGDFCVKFDISLDHVNLRMFWWAKYFWSCQERSIFVDLTALINIVLTQVQIPVILSEEG